MPGSVEVNMTRKLVIYNNEEKPCFFSLGGGGKFSTNEVLVYKGFNIYDNFQYMFDFLTIMANESCNRLVIRDISDLRKNCSVIAML